MMHRQATGLFDDDDFSKQFNLAHAQEVRPGPNDVLLPGPELMPELKQLVADRQPIKTGDSEEANLLEITRDHLLKDRNPVIALITGIDLVLSPGNDP